MSNLFTYRALIADSNVIDGKDGNPALRMPDFGFSLFKNFDLDKT